MAVKKPYFDTVDPKCDFSKQDDELIEYWKKNKIFERSISEKSLKKKWTFLDGPPFITGLPHYGTLLSSIPKDIFPRYFTMKGFRVRRVWGWDCHGLPAENKVEGKLGIKRKKDIEDVVGVGKFIEECKKYVSEVSSEWEWYVDHVGRWVDFKNSYKTMDTDYMESVMWVFKQIYEKGYIYKGLRISLFCPHCSTPISNFEVAMDADNYKTVSEPANTYKYELRSDDNKIKTYILAWSTTPWTKITTTALAVNPKLLYLKVKIDDEILIFAKSALIKVLKDKKYQLIEEITGDKLIGLSYIPHYDYFEKEKGKKCFVIIGGDFVNSDEGTGVVTIAPYGEEDLVVMEKEGIQIVLHVDDEGKFYNNVPNWGGLKYDETNRLINEDLKKRNLLFDEEVIEHSVAFCWRCHTRLIYAPQNAWYIDIQKLKPVLKKNNEKVNWYPKHFKHGRFLKSMESAPDWCISRSRYWGSPVPVWECECGEIFVPESIKELEERSGVMINDLHKPEIDEVKVKCNKCGKDVKRVPEVLDSWIEAGSAAYAERHYPFNNNVKLSDFFPPDFIVEYTGQIRAWFYVLHVIASAIFDSNAFKNVLVTGVVLGTDGRKMSKNFGNYPDPKEMLQKYGGDALRLYLMSTPVMKAEDILISEDQYKEQVRNYMLTLWNVYNFFVTYSNVDQWIPVKNDVLDNNKLSVLDEWILFRLNQAVLGSEISLEIYDTVSYIEILKMFVSDLSLWYIRRSRNRVGTNTENDNDKKSFYKTLFYTLKILSKISAPITPFISETIYRNLTKEESVHLSDWPEIDKSAGDDISIEEDMITIRDIVEKAHAKRKDAGIPVRQPLSELFIQGYKIDNKKLEELVKDELNVKKITFKSAKGKKNIEYDLVITPQLLEEAKTRDLIRKIQNERKIQGVRLIDKISVISEWIPQNPELINLIKKKTLTNNLQLGDKFEVNK